MRREHAWMLVLLCIDLAALGDVLSGPDLWFGPIYLLAICLAAWSMGWRAGQAIGLCCMGLTFAINGQSLYPNDGAELFWNFLSRMMALSMVVTFVANARWAYVREWRLARTDILTGALNRQAFFELGETYGNINSWRLIVYSDLDGLKQINDIQGHGVGDAMLQAFSQAVRMAVRRDDIFARVGGDEFVTFMAVKNEQAGRAVAVRLHRVMNNATGLGSAHIRCSVGALVVPPGAASLDDLVRNADRLMYIAKVHGASLEVDVMSGVRQLRHTAKIRNFSSLPFAGPESIERVQKDRRDMARAQKSA